MILARSVADVVRQVFVWSHRSGRLWLPLFLLVIVVGSVLIVATKATVTTFVYTLF